jgi:selenocysteine-specific elongation factor
VILGTAGHIDHGKSALVEALSAHKVDRLPEEHRRGITLELNFAPLTLPSGETIGIVDVPGHEDLVRTMVSGASGIDAALLVVAADEGPMPQTEEHLAVLESLGVTRGIAVLTKVDLVDTEWLGLVREALRERLERSSVSFGEPLAASVRSGVGLDELRLELASLAREAVPRLVDDLFAMAVDRSFSVSGIGTVVTGSARSGAVRIGEELRLWPAGGIARVRSIESFGAPAERAVAGARIAIALHGPGVDDVPRGSLVTGNSGGWQPTRRVDVRVALASIVTATIARRTRIQLLVGTTSIPGWISPRAPISTGAEGLARITLDRDVVLRGGDRGVIRRASPVETLGGITVLDPAPPARASWPDGLGSSEPAERLLALAARRREGVDVSAIPVLLGIPAAAASKLMRTAPNLRRAGQRVIPDAAVARAGSAMLESLERFHAERPSERGMSLETLRRSSRSWEGAAEAALAEIRRSGAIAEEGPLVRRAGFRAAVEGGDEVVRQAVDLVLAGGLEPPEMDELGRLLGRPDIAAILRLAASEGLVQPVTPERYIASSELRRFADVVREVGAAGEVKVAALRERLGLSRKHLIPLLEWSDRARVTVRRGDTRVLTRLEPG